VQNGTRQCVAKQELGALPHRGVHGRCAAHTVGARGRASRLLRALLAPTAPPPRPPRFPPAIRRSPARSPASRTAWGRLGCSLVPKNCGIALHQALEVHLALQLRVSDQEHLHLDDVGHREIQPLQVALDVLPARSRSASSCLHRLRSFRAAWRRRRRSAPRR